MPAAVAIPAIIGAAGVGASLYGANKNAQATKDAQAANAAAVAAQNEANYRRWLESKGVGANGQPINAKLPRYMKWNPAAVAGRRSNVFTPGDVVVAKTATTSLS